MNCKDYKSCPLYHALMSHLEDEMKRWQNKLKYIDEPRKEYTRKENLDYYNNKLKEVSGRLNRINDFMKGRDNDPVR